MVVVSGVYLGSNLVFRLYLLTYAFIIRKKHIWHGVSIQKPTICKIDLKKKVDETLKNLT